MNRDAMQRREDMLANKAAALGKALDLAVDDKFTVGQLAAAAAKEPVPAKPRAG